MKRLILYCIMLLLISFLPVQKQDVANLEPVQTVWMDVQPGGVVLATDTGDAGSGNNAQEALKDMKENSAGMIYLDTAQYLLVTAQAKSHIPEIAVYLKNTVRICQWEGQGELKTAAQYVQSRKLGERLGSWQKEMQLPVVPAF